MNYIELIRQFWQCNNEIPIGPNATALYFYLLKVCNSLGWKETFKHSDRYISIQLGISVNTVRTAKNRLKQLGLIDFKSPEKASKGLNGSTMYKLLTVSNFDSVPNTDADTVPDTVPDSVADTRNKLNKTKPNINIPPTPPKGEEVVKVSELEKREVALKKLEDELKAKEAMLNSELSKDDSPKKKKADPLNREARKTFEEHFRSTFDTDYYWTPKDAGNMTQLLNKLKYNRKQKNLSIENEEIIYALKVFLSSIENNWLLENFSVSKINSNFNEIASQAKSKANGKTGNNAGIIPDRRNNRNTTSGIDAANKRAEREHLGKLADAILQQSQAKVD